MMLWMGFLIVSIVQPCCLAAERPLPCHEQRPQATASHQHDAGATQGLAQVLCSKLQYVDGTLPIPETNALPSPVRDIALLAPAFVAILPSASDLGAALFRPPTPPSVQALYLQTQRLRI